MVHYPPNPAPRIPANYQAQAALPPADEPFRFHLGPALLAVAQTVEVVGIFAKMLTGGRR